MAKKFYFYFVFDCDKRTQNIDSVSYNIIKISAGTMCRFLSFLRRQKDMISGFLNFSKFPDALFRAILGSLCNENNKIVEKLL
jgi:hypothetical protein